MKLSPFSREWSNPALHIDAQIICVDGAFLKDGDRKPG